MFYFIFFCLQIYGIALNLNYEQDQVYIEYGAYQYKPIAKSRIIHICWMERRQGLFPPIKLSHVG